MPSSARLRLGEKWRVEVDINHIHHLRVALGIAVNELPVSPDTLLRIERTGHASLATVAKLATALHITPGELIIWYPVPDEWPDTLAGRGG